MKIAIGADHAGYAWKDEVRDALRLAGRKVLDVGANSAEFTRLSRLRRHGRARRRERNRRVGKIAQLEKQS